MNLSPEKQTRSLESLLVLVILARCSVAGLPRQNFPRKSHEVFANEAEQFKYGSLGAEGDRGIPYFLWLVLPRVFPD